MPKQPNPMIEIAEALYKMLGRGSGPDTVLLAKALNTARLQGVSQGVQQTLEQEKALRDMADPRKRFTVPMQE